MPRNEEEQSHANYGVLIELKDSVNSMGERFELFATQQQAENKNLHARIDQTQDKFITSFAGLKDGIAERGKVTWPIFAAVIGSVAILSGAGATYVSMRTEPLAQAISANTAKDATAELQSLGLSERLQVLAVESSAADARSETDREWITKLLDETRRNAPLSEPKRQ